MSSPVRAGTNADVDRCVELWTRLIVARDGCQLRGDVTRRAREAFQRPVVRFAVARGGPDAFALTLVKADCVALLSRLCVDPSVSSRGLGTALVADAVEHSRGAGLRRIELDVRETNARAISLYERAGFAASSDPWEYDGGDLLVTWSRDLTAEDR